MKPFYYPTYKCRFCEREFSDGHPYCNLKMHTDENFAHFMGLLSTVGALGTRIKELEEANK